MGCGCRRGSSGGKRVVSRALRYPRVAPQKAPTPFPQVVKKPIIKK